ncbi:MAG: sensor histidine kinase [Massilia sp.]|jgi:two-component system sensor histidine kinase TctE|nr:sensor histidine kinase [Massilia sp.]MDB5951106.1 sensor histidine kinase [Massilia sp.]
MTSIRVRLLKWLIGPILLVNLAGASLIYLLAWSPVQLAFDQGLGDAAAALAARLRGPGGPGGQTGIDLPAQAERVLRADPVDAVYFAVRDDNGTGRLLAGDADFPPLRPGPSAYDAVMRGEAVRVMAAKAVAPGAAVAGVAKTLRKRRQVGFDAVRAMLLLEALFTLVLAGLVWFSVTSALRPLARLRANLNARDGDDLAPVGEHDVPYELAPVVRAFDDLLAKLQAGGQARHDFLANVAHQLRTPLAGIKLQLEWLAARHAGDAGSVHSIGLMLQSNERMIRQTNQLLALARAEPSHFEKTRLETLDLAALVAESIQHFVDHAHKKGIDLGFELAPFAIAGDRFLLRDLIDNLVDNALRYTPAGGSVTVSCLRDGGRGVLLVEDSGPGIPAASRERVFSRFVRLDDKTHGSGLGLAIVRDIAAAHGAQVAIDDRQGGGALLSISFPLFI